MMSVLKKSWLLTGGVLLIAMAAVPLSAQVRRANPQTANPQIANPQVSRAVDMFLKIEGVDGESTAEGHEGWIEVESWSWRESRGRTLERPEAISEAPGTLEVVTPGGKSSPALSAACDRGRSLGRVVVHIRSDSNRSGGYDEYLIDDAKAVACGESTSGDVPTESVSFNFTKVEFRRAPARTGGVQSIRD